MRQELIHDALNLLDQDLIEEVDRLREDRARKRDALQNKKIISEYGRWKFRRYAYLAACLCLLVVCAFAVNRLSWKAGSEMEPADFAAAPAEVAVAMESAVAEEAAMMLETTTVDTASEESLETELEEAVISAENGNDLQKKLFLIGNYVAVTCRSVDGHEMGTVRKISLDNSEICEVVDAFAAALLHARKLSVEEVYPSQEQRIEDVDLYRLDFELPEGNIVAVWLMEGGYARMEEQAAVLWQVEPEVFEALMEVLNQ